MGKLLSKIFFFGNLSRDRFNHYQEIIRDVEWKAVCDYIPPDSVFLDVGCGTGYSMRRAAAERHCKVKGIDPSPYLHGVKTTQHEENLPRLDIIQGVAENLPFPDKSFDVVYSSHVLEHAESEEKMLEEIRRVLKDDGVLIIGMPTASMALLRLFTEYLLTSHQRIFDFIRKKAGSEYSYRDKFTHIFFPVSHSEGRGTLLYDLSHYRVSSWEKLVSSKFIVRKKLFPALYPYPDFLQFFKLRKFKNISSSVFFICEKQK